MAEITLTEAKQQAKQMSNFFKAFKLVDETLDQAVAVEELLQRNEEVLAGIKAEIESLQKKKEEAEEMLAKTREESAKMMSEINHEITTALIQKDEMIQQYETEKQTALDELTAFQKKCEISRATAQANLTKDLEALSTNWEERKAELLSLQSEAEKKLEEAQARIAALKQSL